METHLTQLDDDVDKIYEALRDGFSSVADQLEKNRRTWQWGVGIFIAFASVVCAIVAIIVSSA